ncbi:hypothetical protein [Photobacterium leiognathi]|uniref:hypothetical protein n=1 Tax=Photobacterium leiognathi TaxID=553611 RepID=UPI002981B6A5|nr:hypothetical protein [Photobacterium leiognathi]
MLKNKMKIMLLASLMIGSSADAIGIDQMIKFSENGEATFSITNNDGYRQYISAYISDVKVKDGELTYIPYTRDNISDWSLEIRPPRTVIDDKMRKSFKAVHKATVSNENYDQVYQITFVPTPYFPEGKSAEHAVQVAVGFAPLLVVPAKKDQPLDFVMSYKNDEVQINSSGGSYLNVFINTCPITAVGEERNKCYKVVYALKDRNLKVVLTPEMLAADKLQVEVRTHNGDYKEKFILTPGQTIKK